MTGIGIFGICTDACNYPSGFGDAHDAAWPRAKEHRLYVFPPPNGVAEVVPLAELTADVGQGYR